MLFLIQLLIIAALNLSNLVASNDQFAFADQDDASTRNFILFQTENNIADYQRDTLSYTQKFFCRTASMVTAGIILYELYSIYYTYYTEFN